MPRQTRRKKTSKKKPKYTRKVYNSQNGMMTSIWGPPMWHVLHTISFNYPVKPTERDKDNYRVFIDSLKHILPCGKCRENLIDNLKVVPLRNKDLTSRDTFSHWMYRLHEHINSMLGKQSGLDYNSVRERYEHFRARCGKPIPTKEAGCTKAMKGRKKTKCVLKIVPHDDECATMSIDERCKI